MRDLEELWTILDKEYKRFVRKARKQEKVKSNFIYYGLCYTINDMKFRCINLEEYYYLLDTIDNDLKKGPKCNWKGQKRGALVWLFAHNDVNSRYKWIKKQKELSKQSKQTE